MTGYKHYVSKLNKFLSIYLYQYVAHFKGLEGEVSNVTRSRLIRKIKIIKASRDVENQPLNNNKVYF